MAFSLTVMSSTVPSLLRPLQLLRQFSRLFTGVLFIPILTNVMRALQCDTTWLDTGWKCYTGQHLGVFIATLPLLAVMVPIVTLGAYVSWILPLQMLGIWCASLGSSACHLGAAHFPCPTPKAHTSVPLPPFAVALCVCDRDPNSESPASKAHGRVDALMVLCRTVLVTAFTFDKALGATALLVFTSMVGFTALYSHYAYMPYFKSTTNQGHTAAAAVFCWATFCTILLSARDMPTVCSVC